MNYRKNISLLLCVFFFTATNSVAQESAAKPEATSGAATRTASQSGPGSALSKALAAACSQNQAEFTRVLTVRNQESFSRMTPAARVSLMKRFVLLDEPGKAAISANPSGRPIVRCDSPGGAVEMQIGGADVRDNIAFLPLELHETTDSTGASARQINMGLVREEGDWKLLSLGVLLLDLPALEAEWDESEIEATEKEALESLKTIASAVDSYRNKYPHLPESLANLASPARGKPSAEAADLLEADLAKGAKDGYLFRYVIVGASDVGAPAKYELSATPLRYGQTGRRSFFRDSKGIVHAADRQGAVGSETDAKAE
ncbi:MAG TPA: hypothetical protein VE778_01265 [Candidatus Bathyarchaeia archaeon]|jgi:hypothetical protein|nr:hypothetical protein [Candidatus Bathyarchaeia archaeon]